MQYRAEFPIEFTLSVGNSYEIPSIYIFQC